MPTGLTAAAAPVTPLAVESRGAAGRVTGRVVGRGRAGWRSGVTAARWLLLGGVLIGLFGMHVLTVEDAAGGHGMLPPALSGHAGHGTTTSTTTDQEGAADSTAPVSRPIHSEVAAPDGPRSGAGGHDGLTSCVLFLVLGGAALLFALLAYRRRGTGPGGAGSVAAVAAWLWRRGPPAPWPRVALCVIRV